MFHYRSVATCLAALLAFSDPSNVKLQKVQGICECMF
jgi:hypothetical protein